MAGTLKDIDQNVLRTWMVKYISSVLDLPADGLQTSANFASYGFDSVEAVVMAGVMEEEFGVPIDPIQFFEQQSIDDFVKTYAGGAT